MSSNEKNEGREKRYTPEEISEIVERLGGYLRQIDNVRLLNDVIFKRLLGEPGDAEERLMSFLNAIRIQTGQPKIVTVTIEPSQNYPDSLREKITFLDIRATDGMGTQYNVEVQLVSHTRFVSRAIYYNSKLHGSQLAVGDDYEKLHSTISIILADFRMFKEYPEVFQSFLLTSVTNPRHILSEDVQFHFIQLGRTLSGDLVDGLAKELADWLYFLNFPRTSEAVMSEILSENPTLAGGGRILNDFMSDPIHLRQVEEREKNRRDLVDIHQTGFALGLKEGEARGRAEVARMLLREGMETAVVAKLTGLMEEDVERLR